MKLKARIKRNCKKVITWLMISLIVFIGSPISATYALPQLPQKAIQKAPPPATPQHPVRKGPHKLTRINKKLSFSASPTDLEIKSARVFTEPLLPISSASTPGENKALATALMSYRTTKDEGSLSKFLKSYPKSKWAPSLELNMGTIKFYQGFLSDAKSYWQSSWETSKDVALPEAETIANKTLTQLLFLNARIGNVKELQNLLAQGKGRKFTGTTEQEITSAREALSCMKHHPELAFRCGPFAINNILNIGKSVKKNNSEISKFASTSQGTNLYQLLQLAHKVGLKYQVGKRISTNAPIIVPAVLHWKQNHFGAIVSKQNNKYRIKDPTFARGSNMLITKSTIDLETDGYFLVPAGVLPSGWKTVSDSEAKTIWGKGFVEALDDSAKMPSAPKTNMSGGQPECGMAFASAFSMQATSNITDTPLSYTPPVGPPIDFTINYNYLEANQPSTFTFTNLGEDWSLNWVSYLTVDGSDNVTVRVRGGGSEYYAYNTMSVPYYPNIYTQALIVNTGVDTWERHLADGSVEVFDQSDGSGNIFMSQVIDPQGNSALVQYDGDFRITTITDAIGQQSTITYVSNSSGNAGFYKIAQITDPFSRSCSFTYDAGTTTLLTMITDVIGMTSNFTYETSSSFITLLTTPYGSTSMYRYTPIGERTRGLRFSFPDNTSSTLEDYIGDLSTSYFWDRQANALYPSDQAKQDFSHALTMQWVIQTSDTVTLLAIPSSVKNALETQQTLTYANQTSAGDITVLNPGPDNINKPITVSRSTTGGTQTYSYTYNDIGHVTQSIDPIGRKFTYAYDTNKIDLTELRETKSSDNFWLGKWVYNAHHRPTSYIDGSGQETQYGYNGYQELTTFTDATSNVTTLSYDGDGYLTSIDGPLSGNDDVTTFAYDGFGRLYTVTNSQGYVITYSYDDMNRVTQITYPDGTAEKVTYDRLDAVLLKDRNGRWTQRSYDSMGRLAYEIDPLGRKTQYSWCSCGSLGALIDPAGNATSWDRDVEGRVITKTYADNSETSYTYDTSGRLATRLDALNQTATYSYNLDDTLSGIAYSNAVHSTSSVSIAYDAKFPRLYTVGNGWGTYTYTYNDYITDPTDPPITGGGRLASITNNVISNSDTTYSYDALGRTTNRSINTSTNSLTWTYDAISRVTAEANNLGSFSYAYVDNTPGSSKGDFRLSSITYPNSQSTNFSYYNNTGDERLQQIENLNPSSVLLSKFNYAYNPAGEITNWQQKQNGQSISQALGYDLAGQLASVQTGLGRSGPPYSEQYYYNYDLASNRKAVQTSRAQIATIGGTATTSDILTVTVIDSSLGGGQKAITYTVQSGDTLAKIAAGLAANITADTDMQSLGVDAASTSNVLTIKSVSPNITTYTSSLSGGATETIALGGIMNGTSNITVGGTKTTSDVLTVTVTDSALTGGHKDVPYTVQSGDTLTSIATGITTAINADTDLQAIEVSASSASTTVSIQSLSSNATTYSTSVSMGATETLTTASNMNGMQTAAIGGTKTTSDQLTITFYDAGLSGGSKAVSYTVQSGDTLSDIAAGIATSINGDSDLAAIGVTSNSVSTVLNISSVSINKTTYAQSTSGGATETITLGTNTGTTQSTFNNVNELTGISAGGAVHFEGTTNKAVKSVTINSNPATLNWSESFKGNVALSSGDNSVSIVGTDGGNNTKTNTYKISAKGAGSQTLTYDANGNMTSDGTNSYDWDAENRLIKITYPGIGNNSQYTYDGLGRRVKIIKQLSSSTVNTKQFVMCGAKTCEERDGSSTLVSQFFNLGEYISSNNHFYAADALGSIREMTDNAGTTIEAQYFYSPYGRVTKLQGGLDANFQYAGYYFDAPSSLNLTLYRAYNPALGRWINRDPIEESGGINLYAYCANDPINLVDLFGLDYWLLLDTTVLHSSGSWGHSWGHTGSLVGNAQTGYTYFSSSSDPSEQHGDPYNTLEEFQNSEFAGRYPLGVHIPTSPEDDAAMKDYGLKNYRDFNPVTKNCSNLSKGIMNAGGIGLFPSGFPSRPKALYNSTKNWALHTGGGDLISPSTNILGGGAMVP